MDFTVVDRESADDVRRKAAQPLGWPVFVKPCGAGSSLGVSRADNEAASLCAALTEALKFDTRALVEKCIDGREIECAVMGNAHPRAFLPGESSPPCDHAFYDYDAKYIPDGARLEAPAKIDAVTQEKIMGTAEAAYSLVRCEGMARVDFFLEKAGAVYINEINTIPGFTSISMFPRMCEASGLPYAKLLDELIGLAMERDSVRRSVRYEK